MAVKLVSKINHGVVEVSDDYAKVLLAKKNEWQKLTDFAKEKAEEVK